MDYLSFAGLHAMWPEDKRFLITFDDLIKSEEAAHRLIRFAGGCKCPDRDMLHKIRELARDSQRSLGKIEKPDLYERVVRETATVFRSDAIPDID